MKKIAIVLMFMLSCTDSERTENTLANAGYTNINITGYDWGACSDSDSTCTGFTATGPTGRQISGAVGCGRTGCSKSCTIRFD